MRFLRRAPSVYELLFVILAIAAVGTWLIPAGDYATVRYDAARKALVVDDGGAERLLPATRRSLEGLGVRAPIESFTDGSTTKPVSVPGTYRTVEPAPAGPLTLFTAPVAGSIAAADVIFFVLVIGGFVGLFNRSGAFDAGLAVLAMRLRGREHWLVAIVTLLMALGGSTFGLAEETLAFYPLLAPVFLAAGYDRMVPLAVIFGGSQIGTVGAVANPFSTIIASTVAGVNWTDGMAERATIWLLSVLLLVGWILHYAGKVRRDPARSLAPPDTAAPATSEIDQAAARPLTPRLKLLLLIFAAPFVIMMIGVARLGWWFPEMTALFLGAAVLVGLLQPGSGRIEAFLAGARDLLGVAFVIGLARGVSVILERSNIDATMLHSAAQGLAGTPPVLFILGAFAIFLLLTLVIPSTSGLAVLTMPLMGPLAIAVGASGPALISAYLFGNGLMNLITPAGLVLPSLAMLGIGYGAWLRFIAPVLAVLALACIAALAIAA
ncbi:MAG TPA: hypothetical protein VF582_04645 [Allosphingosinicella sp.]|jgi:uncharacterized ion transporter superfamily protein YfcC